MSQPGSVRFGAGIQQFADKTNKRITRLKRAVGLKLFAAVIQSTPVGNPRYWRVNAGKNGDDDGSNNFVMPAGYVGGRLRANWNFSTGHMDKATTDNVDASGGPTAKRMTDLLKAADPEADFYLTNSLPYAHRIEFDGWSHTQAPQGMVRLNVTRFQQLVDEELRKITSNG